MPIAISFVVTLRPTLNQLANGVVNFFISLNSWQIAVEFWEH
jgi:hypothetical protein